MSWWLLMKTQEAMSTCLLILTLKNYLDQSDDSCAVGSDDAPSFLITQFADFLAPLTCSHSSAILFFCEWPSYWKIAFVSTIPKSESTKDITNYKPISIVSKLSLTSVRTFFIFIHFKVRLLVTSNNMVL